MRGGEATRRIGALLLIAWGASGMSCNAILGVDDFDTNGCPEEGARACSDNTAQVCRVDGAWENASTCTNQTCGDGFCLGICEPLQDQCVEASPRICSAVGQWEDKPACQVGCLDGACIGPSCADPTGGCGLGRDDNCCHSAKMPTGTFHRDNDTTRPATVSAFRLDRYEVTAGRFRVFLDQYPASRPGAGAGAHPRIANSGWDPAWDGELPATREELWMRVTLQCEGEFTLEDSGFQDDRPMNCVSFYEAFAFCAWDGGRLPTAAEWGYAAAGGAEQRYYPWSSPPSARTIDTSYAQLMCDVHEFGCDVPFFFVERVGSRSPKGDGKWSHSDLVGNVWEWNLDTEGEQPKDCRDCAVLSGSLRVTRGGGFTTWPSDLGPSTRNVFEPRHRSSDVGFRCARDVN